MLCWASPTVHKRSPRARHGAHHVDLQLVGVLEFVDHNELEFIGKRLANALVFLQRTRGKNEQVVVVERRHLVFLRYTPYRPCRPNQRGRSIAAGQTRSGPPGQAAPPRAASLSRGPCNLSSQNSRQGTGTHRQAPKALRPTPRQKRAVHWPSPRNLSAFSRNASADFFPAEGAAASRAAVASSSSSRAITPAGRGCGGRHTHSMPRGLAIAARAISRIMSSMDVLGEAAMRARGVFRKQRIETARRPEFVLPRKHFFHRGVEQVGGRRLIEHRKRGVNA